MAINDCRIFQVPKIIDPRGNLSVIEVQTIPFENQAGLLPL